MPEPKFPNIKVPIPEKERSEDGFDSMTGISILHRCQEAVMSNGEMSPEEWREFNNEVNAGQENGIDFKSFVAIVDEYFDTSNGS